jgi:hypothetical protein
MAILNEEPEFEKFKILTASVPIENCLNRGVHPRTEVAQRNKTFRAKPVEL